MAQALSQVIRIRAGFLRLIQISNPLLPSTDSSSSTETTERASSFKRDRDDERGFPCAKRKRRYRLAM